MNPLTREEVLKWPPLGPMGLDPARVLALFDERDTAERGCKVLRLELEEARKEIERRVVVLGTKNEMLTQVRAQLARVDEDWNKAVAFASQPKTPSMQEIIAGHDQRLIRAAADWLRGSGYSTRTALEAMAGEMLERFGGT